MNIMRREHLYSDHGDWVGDLGNAEDSGSLYPTVPPPTIHPFYVNLPDLRLANQSSPVRLSTNQNSFIGNGLYNALAQFAAPKQQADGSALPLCSKTMQDTATISTTPTCFGIASVAQDCALPLTNHHTTPFRNPKSLIVCADAQVVRLYPTLG